ncbi:NAD(P)-binding protein [Sarocladium strictum]
MSRFAPTLRALARRPMAFGAAMTSSARPFHTSLAVRNAANSAPVPGILPEMSLKDKVIIVSGGARGLGLVQAEALMEAGATVHTIDRLPTPENDPKSEYFAVSQRAKHELNSKLYYHESDVRDVPGLNKIVEEIATKEGRLDGLIAAAGINHETSALEYSGEEVDRMLGINVKGAFVTAQAVARQMIRLECPGSICMIASMSAAIANKGMTAPLYNPSKAAVVQLAKNLAMEWGPHGIRVNTISPGYIVTAMTEALFDVFPERREAWAKDNMLGRLSMPKEYRGAAVFLLSDASSFMTGGDLRIDGGHTAW